MRFRFRRKNPNLTHCSRKMHDHVGEGIDEYRLQGINRVVAAAVIIVGRDDRATVDDRDVWVFETTPSTLVSTGTSWTRSPSPHSLAASPPISDPTLALALSLIFSPSTRPTSDGTPVSTSFSFSFFVDPATAARVRPEDVGDPHPT